jgi:hypothetical protein
MGRPCGIEADDETDIFLEEPLTDCGVRVSIPPSGKVVAERPEVKSTVVAGKIAGCWVLTICGTVLSPTL